MISEFSPATTRPGVLSVNQDALRVLELKKHNSILQDVL